MKILWLCNIVLPDFCDEYGFKRNNFGGWITGMLHQLEGKVDIAFCFPIYNPDRAKDGEYKGHRYYSFQFVPLEYKDFVKDRFKEIINDYNPDIIHIWGTEYPHTLAMVNAAEETGVLERVILNIQGLVSICAKHYCNGIPNDIINREIQGFKTISQDRANFIFQGIWEEAAIKKVKHVIGRTDWDRACTRRLNRNVNYYFCGEILRDGFYEHANEWRYEKCEKQSIFVSQANYPVKGFHVLLKAMPDILAEYPSAYIYVAGGDVTKADKNGNISPYGIYIKQLIDEYDLRDKVEFTGTLDEQQMISMYLKANVFVLASSIENSPNSLYEAVVIGVPCVASYVGGVPQMGKYGNVNLYQQDAEYMLAYYIKETFIKDFLMDVSSSNNISDFSEDKEKNGNKTLEVYKRVAGID